ncbi:hypothetical protein ACEPAG_6828 [Sanghuangporus baumii]
MELRRMSWGRRKRRRSGIWILVGMVVLMLQICGVHAFDNNRNDNVCLSHFFMLDQFANTLFYAQLAVYWGQNSGGDQQRLSFYCQDDVYDVIPLAFLYVFFGTGGQPMMSFANTCNEGNGTFPGTALSDCSFLASDVKDCQSKGKIITISLGGAASSVGFVNQSQAEEFATTIWDNFLGGESDVRPFGDAVLDGVDLDIEGGLPTYYNNFVDKLRTYTDKADKTYYVTAAPQCPFPDAYTGPAINQSHFDAIYVQFYNNYCGLNYPQNFDFGLWDTWARTQSPNKDVKIYIGAPGSATAANQGYVDIDVLEQYALEAQGNYTTFGGVMLWDASDAYQNNRYDNRIKEALAKNGQDIPDGGSNSGSGSGDGDGGGNGGGTSTPPNSNGGSESGTDGGGRTGVQCVHVQTEDQETFAISRRSELLGRRRGVNDIYDETRKMVTVLSSIARHHFTHFTSSLSKRNYSRALHKYRLYSRRRFDASTEF